MTVTQSQIRNTGAPAQTLPPAGAADGDARPGQETRDRILDAAEAAFMRYGFEGASMRTITAAAGVNLAAANYHFGSKEGLLCAVFRRRLDGLNRERLAVLDVLEAEAGGAPLLAIGWRPATVTYAARGDVPFVLAVGEVARGSPVARADLLVGASPLVAPAQLGTMRESPADALTAGPPGGRTRQWVLWGVLIAAVAVLGGMAWRLFRTSAPPPPDASA